MSELRAQVYSDPRSAEALAPFHVWARTHEPGWTYTAVRVVLTPIALLAYRTRARGRGNVPSAGALILAPNHFSNMDHFFCGVFLRRRIRFMSKSQFFGRNPLVSYLFRVSGHFPVRRGHRDEEAFVTAQAAVGPRRLRRDLRRGRPVAQRRSRTNPGPGSGAWPWSPGRRSCRSRSTGRWGSVSGGVCAFRRSPSATASRSSSRGWHSPTREQQLEAAERIFGQVRALYADLDG